MAATHVEFDTSYLLYYTQACIHQNSKSVISYFSILTNVQFNLFKVRQITA